MSGPATGMDATCAHCGSPLRANAHYCNACGKAAPKRQVHSQPVPVTNRAAAQPDPLTASAVAADQIVLAGPGVRCCSFLLDLAVMASPVLPLATVGAILGVAEVVYLVVPVAFVAVWIWMQIWQGFSGTSFGKSVLGLRLIREADRRAPGFPAAAGRSLVFAATGGLAALPAIAGPPRGGMHDRVSGLVLIDIAVGANPLGPRQQTGLRRTVDRGLKSVHSPVPLGATGQR